jgi:hypothetical protein
MPTSRILANGTNQVKNGPGKLNAIVIGTKGASSNTMTLWDGSNAEPGSILTVIDTTANVGTIDFKNIQLRTGLKIVTATGTAPDALVIFDE